MKIYIKIFLVLFLIFQINSTTAHTIFVVGPGGADDWHSDLKKTYQRLKKRIGKRNFKIFPKINIESERNIYATYVGDLDKLADELATKIVNDFIQINSRSINEIQIKKENEIKTTQETSAEVSQNNDFIVNKKDYPDKEKTVTEENEKQQESENNIDKTELEIKAKNQKEKISLISYGKGAHVLVGALYKLKKKISQKAEANPNFGYFLEDIISDQINGYQTPAPPQIFASSSFYAGIHELDDDDDASETDSISSIDCGSISSCESSNGDLENESGSEVENKNVIKVDLTRPLEEQLTIEQMNLLQGKIHPQNQNQSEQLEMLKLMMQIKQLEKEDEYAGLNPKLKLAGKITLAFLAVAGSTVPVIITGIVGPILTAIIVG
ncbi:MAG: hypothetical protein ABIA74_02460 [bacterium]